MTKNLTTLLLTLLVLGGCGDSEPKPKTIKLSMDSMIKSDENEKVTKDAGWYVVIDDYGGKNDEESKSLKNTIFTALFDRCEEFGWSEDEDIAACIKQEAFRDLQMQEQQHQMRMMERRLARDINANNSAVSKSTNDNVQKQRPLILDILSLYAQQEQNKQTRQMQRDIQALKSANRSMKNKQNTQAALKFLYKGKR